MTSDDQDRDLRHQLRALDPAASLPPADPATVARLLEHTMSDDLDYDIPETRQTGVHERSRLTWLVAAAAVLLIAGVSAFVLVQRGTDDVPAAGPGDSEPSTPAQAATVTTLDVPGNIGAAKCAVPSSEILAGQALAFDGVVDEISGGTVTLTPTMFYAGEPTDIVRVEAPPEMLQQLLLSVDFQVGQRYLVSALDGQVSVCGFSATWSPELEQLYVEAFPGVTVAGPVAGLVLAAGAGSRMGMPKVLMRDADGASWLQRSVAALVDGGCDAVTVVLGARSDEAMLLVPDGVAAVVADDWADGMSTSLRAGLAALGESEVAVLSLVDLPDVTAEVVRRVVVGAGRATLARATYDGRPGHPVVIGRDHWAGVAASATGDFGARHYLDAHEVTLVECGDLATGRDQDER